MFTGIIEQSGVIESHERVPSGARITIAADFNEPLVRGESVAVNGVCLTVLPLDSNLFAADLSSETLDLTTLGQLALGTTTNLERAMRAGDRLGGHIVQGHVDATGSVTSIRMEGEFAFFRWSFPPEFADLLVPKGSIAVDGISLTVVDPDANSFGAALIPETLRRTTLGAARVGDRVNLEFDVMAKYARQMLAPYRRTLD